MNIPSGLSLSLAIFLFCSLVGCITPPLSVDPSWLSPLQVRAMETRTYTEQDTMGTLKTVLNVLQDEGYLVDYANSELGILHAHKTTVSSLNYTYAPDLTNYKSLISFLPLQKFDITTATVNVSEFENQVKVRINFQHDITGPVTDLKVYQTFFAKLDRGVFIQKQKL
jgi:hypothetical protein